MREVSSAERKVVVKLRNAPLSSPRALLDIVVFPTLDLGGQAPGAGVVTSRE